MPLKDYLPSVAQPGATVNLIPSSAMHLRKPQSNGQPAAPASKRAGLRGPAGGGPDCVGNDSSELGRNKHCRGHHHEASVSNGQSAMESPLVAQQHPAAPVTTLYVPEEVKSVKFPDHRMSSGDGAERRPPTGIPPAAMTSWVNTTQVSGAGSGTGIRSGADVSSTGRGGGVFVTAPARPAGRTHTPAEEKRSPPTPLALSTSMPIIVPGCGACAETVQARLDEPVLLKEDRHTAGIFGQRSEDDFDSGSESGSESDHFERIRGSEATAAAETYYYQQEQAAESGVLYGSSMIGLGSGDGRRQNASWRSKERTKTFNVGLITCLNIGERVVVSFCSSNPQSFSKVAPSS